MVQMQEALQVSSGFLSPACATVPIHARRHPQKIRTTITTADAWTLAD